MENKDSKCFCQSREALPENPVVAMAYIPLQTDLTTYNCAEALNNGTLFPELNKNSLEVNAMENRSKLLRELSSAQFAAWELHLYLDTHKCDKKALEMHRKYGERAMELTREYEERFGPLTHANGSGEAWLCDPWPWEIMECDC